MLLVLKVEITEWIPLEAAEIEKHTLCTHMTPNSRMSNNDIPDSSRTASPFPTSNGMDSIKPLILAAGLGKRMNSELPKVLLPLKGKPMLSFLLEAVEKSNLAKPATLIVGAGSELVKKAAGPNYQYVLQEEQLGTGHAVQCAEKLLRGNAKHIMVLYGDHPLVDAETINRIGKAHLEGGNPITMATTVIDDFKDWRASFYDYGRIIRNGKGEIKQIIERKDATEDELEVKEVNPSYFCFNAEWLWEKLKLLTTENAQKEYYLTTLPKIAWDEKSPITMVSIDPKTALGANTPEQFAILEKIMTQ